MKSVFRFLFFASFGAWVAGVFVTAYYENLDLMLASLAAMYFFGALSVGKR